MTRLHRPPLKIKHVNPVYPIEAQGAGMQGVVIIEATIGPDGKIQDAKIIRSIPLLDAPALGAVKQWEYTPTLLNGVRVPVIMGPTPLSVDEAIKTGEEWLKTHTPEVEAFWLAGAKDGSIVEPRVVPAQPGN